MCLCVCKISIVDMCDDDGGGVCAYMNCGSVLVCVGLLCLCICVHVLVDMRYHFLYICLSLLLPALHCNEHLIP